MFELVTTEGEIAGKAWSGFTLLGVCQSIFTEFVEPQYQGESYVVALMPGATSQPETYAVLAFLSDGTVKDTGHVICGREDPR